MYKEVTKFVTDKYDRHARLYPALLTALPLSLLAFAAAPALLGAAGLGSFLVASGVPILAINFARSKGKQLEPPLYKEWGGMPTTVLLRFRGASNRTQVSRWHDKLQKLVGDSPSIPSLVTERSAPGKADEIYETAVAILREATRDTRKFPLVFKELCDYGLKRNLLGLKPIGLTFVAASFIGLLAINALMPKLIAPQALLVIAAVDVVATLYWLLVVRASWVKSSAFTYARTLLAALERV